MGLAEIEKVLINGVSDQDSSTRVSKNILKSIAEALVGNGVVETEIICVASWLDVYKIVNQPSVVWVITHKDFIQLTARGHRVNFDEGLMVPIAMVAGAFSMGNSVMACGPGSSLVILPNVGSAAKADFVAMTLIRAHQDSLENEVHEEQLLATFPIQYVHSVSGVSGLRSGDAAYATFYRNRLELSVLGSTNGMTLPLEQVTDVSIGGPGVFISEISSNFVPQYGIETHVRISGRDFSFLGISGEFEPMGLERVLAPVFVAMNSSEVAKGSQIATPTFQTDVAESLVKLADLHTKGLLTDEEFRNAKAKLIEGA